MKKILYFVMIIVALTSCSENERLVYSDGYKAYFGGISETSDSVTVSLYGKPVDFQYNVTVRLIGDIPTTDKKIRFEVDPEKSTAKEGIHFKALEPFYIYPAGATEITFPVILHNTDKQMENKHFILALRMVQTEDVGMAYENRSTIRLRLSVMLKAPEGTGYYDDGTAFANLFGVYSKVKHALIVEIVGHDFWDGNYGVAGGEFGLFDEKNYYAPYARKLYQYIIEHEVYDENGNLIKPWDL